MKILYRVTLVLLVVFSIPSILIFGKKTAMYIVRKQIENLTVLFG
jgi:cell division protein FtsB